jgi:hypothetical protein
MRGRVEDGVWQGKSWIGIRWRGGCGDRARLPWTDRVQRELDLRLVTHRSRRVRLDNRLVGAKNVVSLEAWRRCGFKTVDHSVERARDLGSLVFLSMDYEFPCHRLPLAMSDQLESG